MDRKLDLIPIGAKFKVKNQKGKMILVEVVGCNALNSINILYQLKDGSGYIHSLPIQQMIKMQEEGDLEAISLPEQDYSEIRTRPTLKKINPDDIIAPDDEITF